MHLFHWTAAIGGTLLAALVMTGCGTSQAPAQTQPSATKSGQGTESRHPAWKGPSLWGNLDKLRNYSLTSETMSGGSATGAGGSTTFMAEYNSPTNYKLAMGANGDTHVMVLILAGGHYYFESGADVLDMGTTMPSVGVALTDAGASWQALFESATAHYRGACTLAGRPGNAYELSTVLPIDNGTSERIQGSTCLDRQTGTPLTADLKWSMSADGQTAQFEDSLRVTDVGDVAPIPAPKGAVKYSQGNQPHTEAAANVP